MLAQGEKKGERAVWKLYSGGQKKSDGMGLKRILLLFRLQQHEAGHFKQGD